MEKLYLIKIGEIALKSGNRKLFEKKLRRNVLELFDDDADYFGNNGRYFLTVSGHTDREIQNKLAAVFGITGFVPVIRTEKNIDKIGREAVSVTSGILRDDPAKKTFKIESRRSDKGFPLDSYAISCRLGDLILDAFPSLSVDCNKPDFSIHCEIREKALLFSDPSPGPGGLPVGCAGKGTLLLSGGIDSPVAAYLMAKRGMKLDAVYFHTPPFTSEKAKEKVIALAEKLAPRCSGIRLFTVPFTPVQLHIKQICNDEETTLLMRACMMKISEYIGMKQDSQCLVTGEALSQVASQTVESLTFTGSCSNFPVFRPLIGYDKEEIVLIARKIGTFDISIRPYDDCCTVFSPSRPIVKPKFDKIQYAYEQLKIDSLLREAAENAKYRDLPANGRK